MKIVILDGHAANPGDLSWKRLEQVGSLTVYDRTPKEETIHRAKDADIILTNKVCLWQEELEQLPFLKYIGVTATGYNVVDVEEAHKRGIVVTNVPAYSTESVVQTVFAHLLTITNRTEHYAQEVRDGQWVTSEDFCYWDTLLTELAGKTMGIIGFGRIGRTTGRIAKAMGMTVLAAGSRPVPEGEEIAEYVETDELFARADVVVLHCPLFPETNGLINKKTIARVKDGVILINNSRGQLIVEQDLAEALESGKVAAAGLDVVSSEPIREDNPLLRAKNCLITPHISWAPKEARERIMTVSAENLKAFAEGHPVHVVNGL